MKKLLALFISALMLASVLSITAGAAGDFYVFHRLHKEPDTILCQDTGVKMAVFDRQ